MDRSSTGDPDFPLIRVPDPHGVKQDPRLPGREIAPFGVRLGVHQVGAVIVGRVVEPVVGDAVELSRVGEPEMMSGFVGDRMG